MDRVKAISLIDAMIRVMNDKELIEALTMGKKALEDAELRVVDAFDPMSKGARHG
jgi:hypothetical protein